MPETPRLHRHQPPQTQNPNGLEACSGVLFLSEAQQVRLELQDAQQELDVYGPSALGLEARVQSLRSRLETLEAAVGPSDLECLLLGRLSATQPTSLNNAVVTLCRKHPELTECLTAGAQPPFIASAEARKVWATLHHEGWARLYRTAGLLLTSAGEARLNELWARKEDQRGR